MAYDTISLSQVKPLEFKFYHGPPKPKPPYQPLESKHHASAVAGEQSRILNSQSENTKDQASKSCASQFETNSLDSLIVIDDSQSESDSDKESECLRKSNEISQTGNRLESVYSSGMGDTIDSEQLDEPTSTPSYPTVTDSLLQKSHPSHANGDGGILASKTELHDNSECRNTLRCQPMQESTSCITPKATDPLQSLMSVTERKDRFPTPKYVPDPNIRVENNSIGTPHDNVSTHKRRRISSATTISRKRRNQSSYTAPKRRLRNAKSAAGQHKQSQKHSWILHLEADPNNSDEDGEYEVEKILDSRIDDGGILQYRVEWVGYPEDQTWYNAGNFKNSPYKVLEYHKDNNACSGPPKMLGWWMLCWDEGVNAEDHPNDDRAE